MCGVCVCVCERERIYMYMYMYLYEQYKITSYSIPQAHISHQRQVVQELYDKLEQERDRAEVRGRQCLGSDGRSQLSQVCINTCVSLLSPAEAGSSSE